MTDTDLTARDRRELELLLRGFMISRMLRLIADLGLANRIALDDEVSVRDLAATCGALEAPLLRILRSLASLGIFRLSPNGMVGHMRNPRCCAQTFPTARITLR